jgi:dienelactone hydrolase
MASPALAEDSLLGGETIPDQTIRYLTFPSRDGDRPIVVAGRLQMPAERRGPIPAVIVMHGTPGVSLRGVYYGNALNRAGVAIFEIDQWGARGLSGGPDGRPKSVGETMADVYGAVDRLAAMPEIDPRRIGILGFSWGGVVAMLAATSDYDRRFAAPQRPRLAAAMAFYPVCWAYNRVPGYAFADLLPIPVRIVTGDKDDYDDGAEPCRRLVDSLSQDERARVDLVVYPGAAHAFDGFSPPSAHPDPFGHRGKGGAVTIAVDPAARLAAREEVVRFFSATLAP